MFLATDRIDNESNVAMSENMIHGVGPNAPVVFNYTTRGHKTSRIKVELWLLL
jgi:hypothetical protein